LNPAWDLVVGEARPFGDHAIVVGVASPGEALAAARVLETLDEVLEAVVGMSTVVAMTVEPVTAGLLAAVRSALAGPLREVSPRPRREILLPVGFDGEDLGDVAGEVGLSSGEVVSLLTSSSLTVAFIGFAPGFPYMIGLPEPLDRVRRRASPRPSVPAGSIALGGGFAGVYPGPSPGGWRLVGRTSTAMFDPHRAPYSTLRAGDRVRLVPGTAPAAAPGPVRGKRRQAPARSAVPHLEVLAPGTLTMVQGAPRLGLAGLGVPTAGPADPVAMALANRLVGNADDAGALEVAGAGLSFQLAPTAYAALVGGVAGAASWSVDGHPTPVDVVVPVPAGAVVRLGAVRGVARAYVAVAGGLEPDPVLGSVSTDVLSGLGPAALSAGDVIPLGPPGRPRARLSHPQRREGEPLRVVPGPHDTDGGATAALCRREWSVSSASSRVGLRLTSPGPAIPGGEVPSLGMVTGAVQVPPAGEPVVLGVDHGSAGGYRVVACVIRADLHRLGRLAPGDRVSFEEVDLEEAARARHRLQVALDGAVAGWFPTAAGT